MLFLPSWGNASGKARVLLAVLMTTGTGGGNRVLFFLLPKTFFRAFQQTFFKKNEETRDAVQTENAFSRNEEEIEQEEENADRGQKQLSTCTVRG